jgi:hypothetical protein
MHFKKCTCENYMSALRINLRTRSNARAFVLVRLKQSWSHHIQLLILMHGLATTGLECMASQTGTRRFSRETCSLRFVKYACNPVTSSIMLTLMEADPIEVSRFRVEKKNARNPVVNQRRPSRWRFACVYTSKRRAALSNWRARVRI